MNVDIRKEEYKAYHRDHIMAANQKVLLHYVQWDLGAPPATTQYASYDQWNKDSSRFPWEDMESSLYRPAPTAELDDAFDDEDDDDGAEGDEDEESSHSQDADGDGDEDSEGLEHSQDEE